MKFTLSDQAAEHLTSDCLIIGIAEGVALHGTAQRIDQASGGYLQALIDSNDISSSAGDTRILHQIPGLSCPRLLILGFGKSELLTTTRYHQLCLKAGTALRNSPATNAISCLHEMPLANSDLSRQVELSLLALHQADYIYAATKQAADNAAPAIQQVICPDAPVNEMQLKQIQGIAQGVAQARELADLPPNICTPAHLEAEALALAGRSDQVEIQVMQEAELRELGMNTLLAVGRGSQAGTRLICLHYRAAGDKPPHVMVGKGVTFDSGGLSLKTREGMEQMKFDMGGAATLLGVMRACVELELPVNLSVVIAAVENMPDGDAYRPGDVITTYEGLTVEVLNTDAEGRLALCDALSWAKRHLQPQTLIDVATLTGACVTALGYQASGLMSDDDELAATLEQAGEVMGDRVWRLPLWPEYQEQLNTPFADMKNIGGPAAGTITAACFLQRFVQGQRWAHLDIAGSLWPGGSGKSATGRPVRMLCQWLREQASA
ncbi:MAG: leucyl aminopeptidase [Wenzhouxiangellaceae bacterium]